MPMLKKPWEKYEPFIGPDLPNRTWPAKRITKAPRWLATDLRDGNQSLASPMTIDQKWAYFKLLVKLGFKEKEVSTPTASTTEYDFTRQIIDTGAVPDDTVESLRGAKKALVSLYYATSPVMLETVFETSQQDIYNRVVEAVTYYKSITQGSDDPIQQRTTWNLMFSPEAFSASDTLYCVRLSEAVKSIWEPTAELPIILTLPATVEMSTPNVYADQVELFSTSVTEREKVCVSLHVHNDRGCAIAAAELGQMAGAERVEGCLFGNGERAGNVDLVTLALNLYSQGVDPGVDFSDIGSIRGFVECIIKINVHPRTPYSGSLYFTAYSGAHQDAISKGLTRFKTVPSGQPRLWKVPYLSMDPADLGSRHQDIIRLNSQSGKGGMAWTLYHELSIELPKGLQFEFSKLVKRASETAGGIIPAPDVANLFLKRYFISDPDPRIISAKAEQLNRSEVQIDASEAEGATRTGATRSINALVKMQGQHQMLQGEGSTVTDALSNALAETSIGRLIFRVSESLETMLFVECQSPRSQRSSWGLRRPHRLEAPELLAALSATLDLSEQQAVEGITSAMVDLGAARISPKVEKGMTP